MAGKDYYKILGVDKNASADDVKKAFRKLAHEHHPDKGGNEAKFKEANEAYQVLGDAEKRKQYDQFGSAAFDGSGGGNPFAGGGNPFGGAGGFNFDFGGAGFEDLGDILGGMFGGGGGGRQRNPQGENIEVGVRLSFKEAVLGVEKEIPITRNSVCARCAGTAAEPGTKMQTCKTCEGKGFRIVTQRTMLGAMQMRQACEECHGTGEKPEKPCTECKGNGVTHGRVTVRVDIPAGVDDGVTVRVRGEGENIGARGEPGDLYLRIRVDADPRFTRDGFTIYVEKKIGFTQAALGDTVDVDTVDGKVEVKIPQGTQSGDELRLRGKGVGSARGRGDQIIRITVVTPTKLDKKTQEVLKELNLKM